MPLKNYAKMGLPDYLEMDEVCQEFEDILSVDEREHPPVGDVADALIIILDHAWHNYEQLPTELGQRIINWALNHWDPNALDMVGGVTRIIGWMGDLGDTTKARAFLENRLKLTNDMKVKQQIEKTLREMSPTPKFKTREQLEAEGKT